MSPQVWPTWVARVTTISHLLTVLSSSVNFYIYSLKHQASLAQMICYPGQERRGSSPTQIQVHRGAHKVLDRDTIDKRVVSKTVNH